MNDHHNNDEVYLEPVVEVSGTVAHSTTLAAEDVVIKICDSNC